MRDFVGVAQIFSMAKVKSLAKEADLAAAQADELDNMCCAMNGRINQLKAKAFIRLKYAKEVLRRLKDGWDNGRRGWR